MPIQVQEKASSIFLSAPNESQKLVCFKIIPENVKSYLESGHVFAKKFKSDIVFIYRPNANSNILNKIITSTSDRIEIFIEMDFNADK